MTITAAMRQCLEELAADDCEEIVCEGILCYIGHRRISRRTVNALLRLVALRDVSDVKGCERYIGNDIGPALLRRPELEDELKAALFGGGGSFQIQNDRIVHI